MQFGYCIARIQVKERRLCGSRTAFSLYYARICSVDTQDYVCTMMALPLNPGWGVGGRLKAEGRDAVASIAPNKRKCKP